MADMCDIMELDEDRQAQGRKLGGHSRARFRLVGAFPDNHAVLVCSTVPNASLNYSGTLPALFPATANTPSKLTFAP